MAAVCEGYRRVVVYLHCRFGNLRTRPANGLARRRQLPPINTQIADQTEVIVIASIRALETHDYTCNRNKARATTYMPDAWRLNGMQGPHDLDKELRSTSGPHWSFRWPRKSQNPVTKNSHASRDDNPQIIDPCELCLQRHAHDDAVQGNVSKIYLAVYFRTFEATASEKDCSILLGTAK
jgi:hypothetical protein